jgi:hypothetical protein
LAAVGLLAAYATWQREPERAPGEVVVIEATKNDLTKVRFEDGAKWVELTERTQHGDDGEPAAWLHLSARADAKPPVPERELRGSDGAKRLYERFAPLRAARALGTLEAGKLKELGLDAPKKRIEVSARGEKRVLLVGSSPFNVSDPYVKDERDGRVYVLGGGIVSELDSAATRLIDRTLHAWKPTEYDGLVVTVGSKKRELVQTSPETAAIAKLASKKTPQKPDDLARNWHDKLWRAPVSDVLGVGEKPAAGEPVIALRVDYSWHGKPRGWIEIGRLPAAAAASSASTTPPPAPEVYARSEHTPSWVKLIGNAEELLKEADKVAAGD